MTTVDTRGIWDKVRYLQQPDLAANQASIRTLGTGALQAAPGNRPGYGESGVGFVSGGWLWTNHDPASVTHTASALPFAADGREWIWKFQTLKDMPLNQVGIAIAATAAAGMTHSTLEILDSTGKSLYSSGDDTTAAWPAQTVRGWTLGGGAILPASIYECYLVMMGTTKPTVYAVTSASMGNTITNGSGGYNTITTAPWTPLTVGSTRAAPPANGSSLVPWMFIK